MISLGIDIGTTRTKVLALDIASGRTLALASAPTPGKPDDGGHARSAPAVLETVIGLLARVVAELGDPSRVVSLCAASVGEEVVLLDAAGRAVGDTIAWYDPRGSEEAAAFARGMGSGLTLSGRWPPDPSFSLFKLLWTRAHRPLELERAVTWTDLGDYVLAGLGGGVVMDWSHASRAGAFDLARRAWDEETIAAAGLTLRFPRLVASRTVIGAVPSAIAARTGLPLATPVVSGGHDHLCAAYGAGVRSTAELFLSAGTSEAHLASLAAPLEGEAGRGVDQGCFVDADSYYIHVNIHSGHFFRQWRSLLYDGVDEAAMYAEVAAVPAGAGGITFEPQGASREGRLDRVPYDAHRAAIMRAVLEGLATRSAGIIHRLEAASGRRCELILVAGHPTRVELWRTLRAAAYDRPMAAVVEPEVAAYGAAVMAAQAVDAPGADRLVARRVAVQEADRV